MLVPSSAAQHSIQVVQSAASYSTSFSERADGDAVLDDIAEIKTLMGDAVSAACGVPFKPGEAAGLRGSIRGGRCIGAWRVGPDEQTSDEDEDEDGFVKPRRGECRLGMGNPHELDSCWLRAPPLLSAAVSFLLLVGCRRIA